MSQQAEEQPAENQALIDQFVEIAGVDQDRARFYLETAGYDLPLALSGFYEGGFDDDEQPEVIFDRDNEADEVQIIEDPDSDEEQFATASRHEDQSKMSDGKKPDGSKKKFATLFSQGGPSNREGDSSGEEDDKGQAFYVGGSEKSGQQVLGPPKKKDDISEKFFQQARERGAEQIDASQRATASAGAAGGSSFAGAGYRLGDAVKPSEKIGGKMEVSDEQPATVNVIFRMYRNGFTLDDEPLRTFEQPADRAFLDSIMNGRLPPELIQAHRGKRINLEMEDHRHEEYKPEKRPVKAFSGQGHTLGSPVPQVVGAGKVGEKAASSSTPNGASSAAAAAPPQAQALPVDDTKPMTNIQVRLGNGDRLVLKLNHHHTISDLRKCISQMRPDLSNRAFMLMEGFPSKELTNESATLEEAKLLNAVIIQRFK